MTTRNRSLRPATARRSFQARRNRPGLKAVVALLAILLALVVGSILFFTVGERVGIAAFAGIAAVGFLIAALAPTPVLVTVILLQLGVITWAGFQIADEARGVIAALTTTEGPVAPPDRAALAAAEQRLEAATQDAAFRLELHEDEITAVLQDGLAEGDQPLRRIAVDIVDGDTPSEGTLEVVGDFKSGDYAVAGTVGVEITAGAVRVEVLAMDLGSIRLPGIARNAVEDYVASLLDSVEDLNSMLADADVDVQSMTIGDDRIVVTGVQDSESGITPDSVLRGLASQAGSLPGAVEPPPERLGPGVVAGTFREGSTYYLALGDSLAANVGVPDPADGYVSRLHNQLQIRDDREYGLYNVGVSGETSGTLIRGGQLDEALSFLRSNRVAYVTVDIGANDLLGHLTSPDCADGLDALPCTQRIDSTFTSYEEHITRIFDDLAAAAPGATIVFVRAYNPFGLGTGIDFERDSSRALDDLNDIAAAAASSRGILVADAFTPLAGTAAVTTHMLDNPADIHPTALGFDVIGWAVLEALEAAAG